MASNVASTKKAAKVVEITGSPGAGPPRIQSPAHR